MGGEFSAFVIETEKGKYKRFRQFEQDSQGRYCVPFGQKKDESCEKIPWYDSQPNYCVNCIDFYSFNYLYRPIQPWYTEATVVLGSTASKTSVTVVLQTVIDLFLEAQQMADKFFIARFTLPAYTMLKEENGRQRLERRLEAIRAEQGTAAAVEYQRSLEIKYDGNLKQMYQDQPSESGTVSLYLRSLLGGVYQMLRYRSGFFFRLLIANSLSYTVEKVIKNVYYNKRPNMTRGMVQDWDRMIGRDELAEPGSEEFYIRAFSRVNKNKGYRTSFPSGHNLGAWQFFFTVFSTPFFNVPEDNSGLRMFDLDSLISPWWWVALMVMAVLGVIFQFYARISLGGWHWLSDILASIGLAFLLVIVAGLIYKVLVRLNSPIYFLIVYIVLIFVRDWVPSVVSLFFKTEYLVPGNESLDDYEVKNTDYEQLLLGSVRSRDSIEVVNPLGSFSTDQGVAYTCPGSLATLTLSPMDFYRKGKTVAERCEEKTTKKNV